MLTLRDIQLDNVPFVKAIFEWLLGTKFWSVSVIANGLHKVYYILLLKWADIFHQSSWFGVCNAINIVGVMHWALREIEAKPCTPRIAPLRNLNRASVRFDKPQFSEEWLLNGIIFSFFVFIYSQQSNCQINYCHLKLDGVLLIHWVFAVLAMPADLPSRGVRGVHVLRRESVRQTTGRLGGVGRVEQMFKELR